MNLPGAQADAVSTVHYTAYTYSSNAAFCIIVYNITLPVNIVEDENLRYLNLQRVNQLLVADFGVNADIFYQVTGSYTLVNRVTGATQLWTGSFYTNLVFNPSLVQSFQRFDRETFTQSSFDLLSRAEEILARNGNNSEWTFESLKDIIFNVQLKKSKNDAIINRRHLRFNARFQQKFNLF